MQTLFGSNFFGFKSDRSRNILVVAENIWIYLVTAVGLSSLTLAAWFWWLRRSRSSAESDIEAFSWGLSRITDSPTPEKFQGNHRRRWFLNMMWNFSKTTGNKITPSLFHRKAAKCFAVSPLQGSYLFRCCSQYFIWWRSICQAWVVLWESVSRSSVFRKTLLDFPSFLLVFVNCLSLRHHSILWRRKWISKMECFCYFLLLIYIFGFSFQYSRKLIESWAAFCGLSQPLWSWYTLVYLYCAIGY